jgi:hypothetical protein
MIKGFPELRSFATSFKDFDGNCIPEEIRSQCPIEWKDISS